MVTADAPQQQDALKRIMAVLNNIETSSTADTNSEIRISRSDFKLIRSLLDTCVQRARIRGTLGQLLAEKDQQLRSTRCQLSASQRTVTRLKHRLQTRDAANRDTLDTEAVRAVSAPASLDAATVPYVLEVEDFSSNTTLPTSAEPFSCRLESGSNAKPKFDKDPEVGSAMPETGATCYVTLAQGYAEKVVQQNVRLKRTLRDLIVQRHGSVAQFLVRIETVNTL